jgi:hypothetical protein
MTFFNALRAHAAFVTQDDSYLIAPSLLSAQSDDMSIEAYDVFDLECECITLQELQA